MEAQLNTRDASEFDGKRILVTGGTRGIGEAIVQRLMRGGGRVIATARSLPDSAPADQFIQAREGAPKRVLENRDMRALGAS